jgi:molybdopterin molybdotransferase
MLFVQEAEAVILRCVKAFDAKGHTEMVGLRTAIDRILATPIQSQLDFPHWDNSAMDGYAVRFEDVRSSSPDHPTVLEIIEEIPAGALPHKTIQAGQAARILTGSMMPAGADTVVMQENTRVQDGKVSIVSPPAEQGAFVRHRGTFYRAGNPLLLPGVVLKAPEIAVLAAAQCTDVPVFRRPRVAVLSTGNELVSPDQPLHPGQIVDSNQYALEALITQMGAEPVEVGIVRDDPIELKQAILSAIESADVVISSGGVSVGDYDYVDRILTELGAEIQVRSIAIKPGKPLTFATFPNSVLYFGLPGNPVSALVTFWRFVQPAIRKLSGLAQGWEPTFVKAVTKQELRSDGKRESYLWGQLSIENGSYVFNLAGGRQNSANLINLAGTNALGRMAIGQPQIPAGESIPVLCIINL